MKRKRPKTYINDITVHKNLRRRWRNWIPDISKDLSGLYLKSEVYWELQNIAKSNKSILKPGTFFNWIDQNYTDSMASGLRRLIDYRKDIYSVSRMLYEILEHPGVITRKSHVSLYRGIPSGFEVGNRTFDNIAGNNKTKLSQNSIRSDLCIIDDITQHINKYVNKRVAHSAPKGQLRKNPTYDNLDLSLNKIDNVFCKYKLLLTATSATNHKPALPYNWKNIFMSQWIK